MKFNKKIVLAMASLGLVATMAIGGTLAYFTDSDSKENVITMGKVDISLVETSKSDKHEDIENGIKYTEVMPGDQLSKDVDVVVEEGSRDAYIAVKIDIVGHFTENDKAVVAPTVDVKEDWAKVAEGFYVYKGTEEAVVAKAVSAKSVIEVFDSVSVPTEWTQSHDFDIEITAYAVQAENVDATTAASELKKLAGIVVDTPVVE